ncbi:MAG TPA: DeoR/GlpR family DNA-binding transcription regulator [bacterium]|nr:DeoR/GlpR transcriptional regulator [Candidatus Omnitrophota bacterium]HOJ60713.1 DeoR/GlpR family DNA-binding transcription regulator [bacterium]HOL92834.1 DeoR/GlpR family DNA-binding transcription regulator [bacterium]HPP02553.1 DeoR/GlpR family DNA-binding transcription regulator [bacterium]
MTNPRHVAILDLLAENGEVTVQHLARRFAVSEMTIRRDLVMLERAGELIRTHGGALLSKAGVIEFSFKKKERECAEEKQAIAREAAALVRPGMALTLDTGTTTLEVARAITRIKPLTVLTSSLAIASVLHAHDHVELVLLGGTARKGNPDLTGWITEENLKRFCVDLAFIGADGVSPEGIYTTEMNIGRVSQAMIAGAKQIVLVVDHRKFEQKSLVRFASWEAIHRVITDSQVSAKTRKWLRKLGKPITFAACA